MNYASWNSEIRSGYWSVETVWEAAADIEREARDGKILEQAKLLQEMRERKEEMRKDGVKAVPGGSLWSMSWSGLEYRSWVGTGSVYYMIWYDMGVQVWAGM